MPRRRRRIDPTKDDHDQRYSLEVDAGDEARIRKQRRRKRRSLREDVNHREFFLLLLQVGCTLLVVCVAIFVFSRWIWPPEKTSNDDYVIEYEEEEEENEISDVKLETTTAPIRETLSPLPVWNLSEAVSFDAFGIAQTYESDAADDYPWKIFASIRAEFAGRYGGENSARAILERGLSTFGGLSGLEHTACRIRRAKEEKRAFSFAFGGYSVTTGRGNFFTQSFPFVMERILRRAFKVLGVELIVRNAAIGGVPSFPYGWCMENFWGLDADVVSWDYSMNEAGGLPEGLQAYLRRSLMLKHRPKLVVKDTHMAEARRNILQHYADIGLAVDSVVVHTDPAAEPFLNMQEEHRPNGFREWRKFGAPPGAPGQAYHHPALKEHEFIGWLLAMEFLGALELIAADQSKPVLKCASSLPDSLPPPISMKPENLTMSWTSLLFGSPETESSVERWTLNPVRCRTTFEPVIDSSRTLESIVVSGTVGTGENIMLPKGSMYYTKGWTLDLSDSEKLAKRKLNRYNGLGFIDSKKAFYGIFASGTMHLFLPYEVTYGDVSPMPKVGDSAIEWIHSVVVCEVNEKREGRVCDAETDVSYLVGGINATEKIMIDTTGTLYYGKKLCIYLKVPEDAKLTSRTLAEDKVGANTTSATNDVVGLSLDISVSDMHIMKKQMACSISHVVWEQRGASNVLDHSE